MQHHHLEPKHRLDPSLLHHRRLDHLHLPRLVHRHLLRLLGHLLLLLRLARRKGPDAWVRTTRNDEADAEDAA